MKSRVAHPARRNGKLRATAAILRMGEEWAQHSNAGDLDGVVATYADDAVYLPPHHKAVHGREAIREYLKAPLGHGVSDLAFEVTYVRQQGLIAWDVGTYTMTIPQADGTKKRGSRQISERLEARGKEVAPRSGRLVERFAAFSRLTFY
jgi:uncharacterized protein (TIGR02246 family)